MIPWADHLTGISDILLSEIVEGEVRYNLGYFAGENTTSQGVGASSPVWPQFGFVSRPADPDEDGAAMALWIQDGDQKRVISTRDNRHTDRLPDVQPGETAVYAVPGNFVRCQIDGAITAMTTDDNTTDGNAIYWKMSPTRGFEFSSPWARIMAGPYGISLVHSSGARLDLGSLGGLPPPFDLLSSSATITAASISLMAGAISQGNPFTPGLANEIAVTALKTWVSAVSLAFTHATPASGMTADNATIQSALTALLLVIDNLGKPA